MTITSSRLLLLATVLVFSVKLAGAVTISGSQVAYQPLQLDVSGPFANESDIAPNPFLDIRLDITFTSPEGQTVVVPGFFAGNGSGGENGTVWRARFTPDIAGDWQYTVAMHRGPNVAVAQQVTGFEAIGESGKTGMVTIANPDPEAPGFLKTGPLSYDGTHYLKFANGSYWIKGGVDSPENFFGYAGFDNTVNQPGGVGEAQLVNGLHHYTEHVDDWQPGDPLFSSTDSGVDSKGIIGAVNYLASEGVNSMYFLLMNLGGDGRDTYPFINATGSYEDNTHYDVSKLNQWNTVLQHMQSKGVAVHFVLGEQEEENKNWLDGGELGVERRLYYREMVARFTYLNALKWNISEESRYGNERHIAFATALRNIDWADHPVAVHSFVDDPAKAYNALLGNSLFNISSIQFSAENADTFTEQWRQLSANAGIPWVIDMDEVGPGNLGLTAENADQLRREVLYPVYFSGGNIEWYFGFQGADIRTENFRTRESMYRYMRYARELMLQHLPFWEMEPDDTALTGGNINDQVFAKHGSVYALYLNEGNRNAQLDVEPGQYTVQWFNPRSGEYVGDTRNVSGSAIDTGMAPEEPQQDWVVLVKRIVTTDTTDTTENENNEPATDNNANDNVDVNSGDNTDATEPGTGINQTSENEADEPELGEANASGSGSASKWLLINVALLAAIRLLLRIRRRSVLSIGLNMLRVQRIKVDRVEQ